MKTTLYRPVLIESAEQAEALAEGTTLTHEDHWPCEKWGGLFVGNDWRLDKPASVVGWTALVPIEAEEEWGQVCSCGIPGCINEIASSEAATHHHYVTPWTPTEEA